MKILAGAGAALLLIGVLALGVGHVSWSRAVGALDRSMRSGSCPRFPLEEAALPAPVVRYLRRALPPDGLAIRTVRLTQAGSFRMGEGPDDWRPFEATELFRVAEPAFYWDARIRMAPGLSVRVLDRYEAGDAGMRARLLGVVPVVDVKGDPRLAEGALARFLAESVWLPTRLAIGPGLSWTPIDERSAEATLRDGDVVVTARFTFDRHGDPVEVSGVRPREVGGDFVDTPWIGRLGEHRVVDGFRIPTYAEVAWLLDGEAWVYWRGTVTEAVFR